MTEPGRERAIRRIVVAVDASPHSLAALRAAAQLAAHLKAELTGIYIEDIRLINLANSPYVRGLSGYSAAQQQVTSQQVEKELRAQANLARRELLALAQQASLRANFQVLRGMIAMELIKAAEQADMLVLGKSGWSRRKTIGSTTRLVLAQCPSRTLILGQRAQLGMLAGVVYDGSEAGKKALLAAVDLTSDRNAYLIVIVVAEDVEEARRLQFESTEILAHYELGARYRWLAGAHVKMLADVLRAEQIGLLILPGEDGLITTNDIETLLGEIDIPVFLAR